MNIPHVLSEVLSRATSLSRILDATVSIVARELQADVCSIYLLDLGSRTLRLAASKGFRKEALGKVQLEPDEGITGTVVSRLTPIATEDARSHPAYRYFPETGEEAFDSYLGVPMSVGKRPVGAIVVRNRDRRSYTDEENKTLQTIAAQLVGVVENARLLEALDQPDGGRFYLEELRRWNLGLCEYRPQREIQGEETLKGSPASEGIAIGKAVFRGTSEPVGIGEQFRGVEQERKRLGIAVERTRSDIVRIHAAAEREADEEHALVFSAHLLLLNDKTLREKLENAIAEGATATQAVDRVFSEIEAQLRGLGDPYLQGRAEDILDLQARIFSYLISYLKGSQGSSEDISNSIVVGEGISPSTVVELKMEGALGIATERGGVTSHGALLARAMGIPAVTGVPELVRRVLPGDDVVVDGTAGTVILRPEPSTMTQYRQKSKRFADSQARLANLTEEPARSPDGFSIQLLANVGIAAEIDDAARHGAEGIGLYRTEFLFLGREDYPTQEEQVQVYRRACEQFPKGPVFFRLLDVGGDKPYPRLTLPGEPNPALGYRSLRLLLDTPSILKDQVLAFLGASAGREIGVIVPMVSSVEEADEAKALIQDVFTEVARDDDAVSPRIGLMIEVPAAVEIVSKLASEGDFLSIGTNDLIQFALAADRDNSRVAAFGDPLHPAILKLIRRTIEAGHAAKKTVGCCGEMAAIPEVAALLLAMKADYLSLSPRAIPGVKAAIRTTNIGRLAARIDEVLALPEARAIRDMLREETGEHSKEPHCRDR